MTSHYAIAGEARDELLSTAADMAAVLRYLGNKPVDAEHVERWRNAVHKALEAKAPVRPPRPKPNTTI